MAETMQPMHDNEPRHHLNASAQSFTPHQWNVAPPMMPFPPAVALPYPAVSQGEVFMPMYHPPPPPPFWDPSIDSPFSNGMLEGEPVDLSHPSMNPLANSFKPTLRSVPPSRSPTSGSATSSEQMPRTPLESPVTTSPRREADAKSYASMAKKASSVKAEAPAKVILLPVEPKRRKVEQKQTEPAREPKRSLEPEQRRPEVQTSDALDEDGWQIAGKRRVSPKNSIHANHVEPPMRPPQQRSDKPHNSPERIEAEQNDLARSDTSSNHLDNAAMPLLTASVSEPAPEAMNVEARQEQPEFAGPVAASDGRVEAEQSTKMRLEDSSRLDVEALGQASEAQEREAAANTDQQTPATASLSVPEPIEEAANSTRGPAAHNEPPSEPESPKYPAPADESTEVPSTALQAESCPPEMESPVASEAISEADQLEAPLVDADRSSDFNGYASRSSALSQSTSSIRRSSLQGDLSRYTIDEEDSDGQNPPLDSDGPSDPRQPQKSKDPPSLTLSIFSHPGRPLRDRMWAILGSIGINVFLPFVNGVMLGFGEIFARQYLRGMFHFRMGSSAFADGPRSANTANVGLRGSGRRGDMPSHAGAKTAAEAATDLLQAAVTR